MRPLPLAIGTIHFVGIGGIGMSGIAEILHNLGYQVQGSDISESANVRRLAELGIPIAIGHGAANLGTAEVVVVSSAVDAANPELTAARAAMIPVVRRAEMLAELMRLKSSIAVGGTHGKTTTTSMIAALLEGAGFDPTVIIGGILNAYGTNARLGAGDWMVVEADESDGTFVKLPATMVAVTNIDAEHLEFYGDFETLRRAFVTFVQNIPFYGTASLCIDHPEVQALIPRLADRKIVTYGISPQADFRATNIDIKPDATRFDIVVDDRTGRGRMIEDMTLPMLGAHNVLNALAALTIASELGIDDETLRTALAGFKGVKRRFTKIGEYRGITIVDDYGHHPVEITAVLDSARQAYDGNIIAVIQPHRYSRLQALFEDFCTCCNNADTVIVADVYPAGEAPIKGIDRDSLVDGLRGHGHRNVIALESPKDLAPLIKELAAAGDLVLCLGAGNITTWAQQLPGDLERLSGNGDQPQKPQTPKTGVAS